MSKKHFRWAVILGVAGFFLAWAFIYNSDYYSQAKIFLYTNSEIKTEFGEIRHAFLYVAKTKNSHANFSFYIFGEKKNASVALRVDEANDHWIVRKADQ